MRDLLKHIYAPAMFVGFGGAALAIVDGGLSQLWLLPVLLAAIACSFTAEQIIPYHAPWNENHDDSGRDVAHAFVNEISVILSAASVPLLVSLLPWEGIWPHQWPLWAEVLMAIAIADIGITLCHYTSHYHTGLWRLHAVHHSVKRMYGFNGLMKHPLHQAIETLAGTFPLLLLGMPVEVGALLGYFIALQLLLQHSNTDMRIGFLRHIFAWAPVHRHHHIKWAGVGDVNFSLFFTIWDRLLGTAVYYPRSFTSDDLGIGKQPDYPTAYVDQLLEPFVNRADGSQRPATR